MGLSAGPIKLYLELWQRGIFKNIKSAVDMGSQELHLTKASFEELVHAAGITDYREADFQLLKNWPGEPRLSARPFYELLGVQKYACVDLNGNYNAIKLNLNFPLEDKTLYHKFDLVTDHGTNEHAFNIAEAYRTMHRLCKPQGYLSIVQSVYKGNGYYLFDASFFEGLAAANNYKVIYSSYLIGVNDEKEFHLPLNRQLLETLDWFKTQYIGICYVFQKLTAADFQYPYQGNYLSQAQKNLGYQLQFLASPSSYCYVPMLTKDLHNVKTKTLLKVLFKRIPQVLARIFRKKT